MTTVAQADVARDLQVLKQSCVSTTLIFEHSRLPRSQARSVSATRSFWSPEAGGRAAFDHNAREIPTSRPGLTRFPATPTEMDLLRWRACFGQAGA